MIDLRRIREEPERIQEMLRTRDPDICLDEILALDGERRSLIAEVEQLKAERNAGSQEVGRIKREGGDADALLEKLGKLSDQVSELDASLREKQERIDGLLAVLPNIPHESVPVGAKDDYIVAKTVGEKPEASFPVKHHLELGEAKGILDFPRAAAIAGSGFPMYVGAAARLEMALIQYMFFHHANRGYTPILPPFVANEESFYVSSQLPKFADEIYHCEKDNLYLNPTAESILVNLHRGEILEAEELPKQYSAAG